MFAAMRAGLLMGVVLLGGCVGLATGPAVDAGETPAPDSGTGGGAATGGGTATGGGAAGGGGGSVTIDAGLDRIPVFIVVGKQQRRAISCDDGRTWTNDVAIDDAWPLAERYRCFSGDFALPDGGTQSTDCDHNAYSSTSLVYADGTFLQTTGWGAPGRFFRSTDGVSWQQVDMGSNVTDVMFDANRFVVATRSSKRSDDLGLTWQTNGTIDVSNGANTIWNVRGGVAGGGVFLVTAQDGTNFDFQFSNDRGVSWQRPTLQAGGRVDLCGAGHPAYGGGVFVTTTWSQAMNATVVCRSSDGAATWTSTTLTDNIESRTLWTGTEFLAWSSGKVHRSPDGITWTSTNTQTRSNAGLSGGPNIGAVARNEHGTFVGVKGGWQVWYEQQRFYRSTDGVVWDELAPGQYKQGHPVTAMVAGFASRSATCP